MTAQRPAPVVSIGLPVYNGEEYLGAAVESILAQTFADFELIICDNASTDGTAEIAQAFAASDPRVRYVRNARNIGLYPNFNRARALARGEFFRWHAHDDVCAPTYLERCVEALRRDPTASMAYPRAVAIDPSGARVISFDWHDADRFDEAEAESRFRRFVSGFDDAVRAGRQHVGLYIFGLQRMSAARRTRPFGGFMWADEAYLAELLLQGRFVEVPEDLLLMRVFGQNTTEVMLKGDLRAWQAILDPSYRGTVGFYLARYERYGDQLRSVARARLGAGTKLRLTYTCLSAIGQRVQAALGARMSRRASIERV